MGLLRERDGEVRSMSLIATISTLTAEELRGWWCQMTVIRSRSWGPGEQAALIERARQLGISLGTTK